MCYSSRIYFKYERLGLEFETRVTRKTQYRSHGFDLQPRTLDTEVKYYQNAKSHEPHTHIFEDFHASRILQKYQTYI